MVLLSSDHDTHLNTEISSVHIVSQEQISSLFGIATDFEEFHEIKVLSVDITADSDWRIHLQQIGLALKHLSPHLYDPQRLLFGQATLTIEVLFEKLEVGLAAIVWRTELLFGRWVESRRLDIWSTESVTTTVVPKRYLHTFTHSLLCADLLAILHRMQSEIYLRYGLLVLHGALGDLEVVPRYVDVHLVELSQDQRVRTIQRTWSWGRRWGSLSATANGA